MAQIEKSDSAKDAEAFAAAAAASVTAEKHRAERRERLMEERKQKEACDVAGSEGNAAVEGKFGVNEFCEDVASLTVGRACETEQTSPDSVDASCPSCDGEAGSGRCRRCSCLLPLC